MRMKEVGIGSRVLNFIIDTLVVFIGAWGLYKWYTFYVVYWGFTYYAFYIFFYATLFVYYTLFEMINSRSIGKYFTMTKVRNLENNRPAWYQIIIRSIIRLTLIDAFFLPFINRTLHDALSKTRVVEI